MTNSTRNVYASLGLLAILLSGRQAEAVSVTLDGTSGSNTSATAYDTTGGLAVSLGFFSEYLIVAGGGGGGGSAYGGGGGAGGLLTNVGGAGLQLTATSHSITVGTGGTGGASGSSGTKGFSGGNSTFTGSLIAIGGGGGGMHGVLGGTGNINWAGVAGGSGGGGGGNSTGENGPGGAGTVGQGNAGGTGFGSSTNTQRASGGGGGAGAAGQNAASDDAGDGGAGLSNSITGAPVFYAGGGGGGARNGAIGLGGTGGGGNGGRGASTLAAQNGTANTGGGGGGIGTGTNAGAGGSGIVIVRYLGSPAGTGGTISAGSGSATGYTLHTFTTVGGSALDLSALDLNARLGLTLTTGIVGSGDLGFNGPGQLTLSAGNSYNGSTLINAGTLALSTATTNNIASSPLIHLTTSGVEFDVTAVTGAGGFTLAAGQTLKGIGTVTGNTAVGGNSTLSPGNSPGTLPIVGTNTWAGDGAYLWEINNATGSVGTNWDLVNISGLLDITATSGTTFKIDITGLTVGNTVGVVPGFNNSNSYSWLIADSTSTVSSFADSKFQLLTTNFAASNPLGDGSFAILRGDAPGVGGDDTQLYLTFIPMPEPASLAMLACGMLSLWLFRKQH
jgi:hypothetical protein